MLFGYLAFGLAFLIIDALLHGWTQQEVLAEIKVLLLGNTSRIIWFFLSLFIVETVFVIVMRFTKTVLSQSIICLFIIILGYVLGCVGWNCYRIGSSLYAYGFYFLGFLAKRYNVFEIGKKKQLFLAIASLVINIFGTIIFLKISQMVLDINSNMHHDIAANYLIALGELHHSIHQHDVM